MISPTIDLAKGWPSPTLLPNNQLSDMATQVLADPDLYPSALLYGPDAGHEPLRDAIASWTSETPAAEWTEAGNVCITGGASQNLACILQTFSDPSYTRHVYVATPTYHLACRIFEDNGFAGRLKAVSQDSEGIDVDRLESYLRQNNSHDTTMIAAMGLSAGANDQHDDRDYHIKRPIASQKHYRDIIYCVPTYSNPHGRVMSLQRRQQLVRLARQYDALIVADDVYDFLTWSPQPVPHKLVDIDRVLDGGVASPWGNVVSNSSFSKILGPGLRIGWAIGTARFIEGLSQCGSSVSGGCPNQFMAVVIAKAFELNIVTKFIAETLVPTYQRRSRTALSAIKRYLSPLNFSIDTEVEGGFFIYLHLPQSLDELEYVQEAERAGVVVEPGFRFQVAGDKDAVPRRQGIRICFAWESDDRIVEGIRRLSEAVRLKVGNCPAQKLLPL